MLPGLSSGFVSLVSVGSKCAAIGLTLTEFLLRSRGKGTVGKELPSTIILLVSESVFTQWHPSSQGQPLTTVHLHYCGSKLATIQETNQ